MITITANDLVDLKIKLRGLFFSGKENIGTIEEVNNSIYIRIPEKYVGKNILITYENN